MKRLQELQARTKYHFRDTVERHSQGEVIAVIREEQIVPPGDVITVEEELLLKPAAIVSLSKEERLADLGGHYNHDTRKLYCFTRLKKGTQIINTMNNGTVRKYTILEHQDKSDYADDLHIYYLERSDLK